MNIPCTPLLRTLALVLAAGTAAAQDSSVDFYGSLRLQAESVRPDRTQRVGDYSAWRDAYSRLGVRAQTTLAPGLSAYGQLELPVDAANLKLRDPYDQGDTARPDGQRLRLAYAGLRGRYGALSYGQQWLPYYNAIAAPVDLFSSYYSGFATYTTFRVADTLAYVSPEFQGWQFAYAYTGREGHERSTSRIADARRQYTLGYTYGETRLAAGLDDRGDAGYGRNRLYGLSASHRTGALYLAAKYETFDTGNTTPGGFASDGNRALNLLASYTAGRNTFKLMRAKVEGWGEHITHLGLDHQYTDSLKLFVEYYRETETAAITRPRGGLNDYDASLSGGSVLLAGLRWDF